MSSQSRSREASTDNIPAAKRKYINNTKNNISPSSSVEIKVAHNESLIPLCDKKPLEEALKELSRGALAKRVIGLVSLVRSRVKDIHNYKRNKNSVPLSNNKLPDESNIFNEPKLDNLIRECYLSLMLMRIAHRKLHQEVEHQKDAVISSYRSEIALLNQKFQNLEYQKSHYEREIRTCHMFQPLESEPNLIEESVWLAEAEGDFAPVENDTEHTRIMKRLDYEKYLRMKMKEEVETNYPQRISLEDLSRKNEISQTVARTQKIENYIKSISKLETLPSQSSLAYYLPVSLYNIYCLISLWGPFFTEKNSIFISGSQIAAIAANKNEIIPLEDLHKLSHESLYEVHPLSLNWKFTSRYKNRNISASFSIFYFTNLKIVSIKPTLSTIEAHLLSFMLPNDSGFESPNLAHRLINGPNSDRPFYIQADSMYGYPYIWLQHLAGLEFLSPLLLSDPSSDIQNPVDYSFSNIFEILKNRLVLYEELQELIKSLEELDILNYTTLEKVPGKFLFSVWNKLVDKNLIEKYFASNTQLKKELCTLPSSDQNGESFDSRSRLMACNVVIGTPIELKSVNRYEIYKVSTHFSAIFVLKNITVSAFIQIPPNFPTESARFVLVSGDIPKNVLVEIEMSVNKIVENSVFVLSIQLGHLQDCLNIYWDVDQEKEHSFFYGKKDKYEYLPLKNK